MISLLHRSFGLAVDQMLCGALAILHRRHARRASTREAVVQYLAACERQTRAEYFALPERLEDLREHGADGLSWRSRAVSDEEFPVNGRARVWLHRVRPDAPTVVMLHALMSASDAGYRLWAHRFNALGWNAAFVHLPFHYSRRPPGHLNGELCWTADLVLTGDTVRQAVVEVRQLLAHLRMEGVTAFGLLGSSYGGWVASLAASLEPSLRFLALLAPMVNIGHAMFEGPTSWTIHGQLRRAGLERALLARHAHLSSPHHALPLGGAAERTVILAGAFDRIVQMSDLVALRDAWAGAELLTVPQAHFGYGMIPRAVAWLNERGLLKE
ncbi:MAG: alpha/beta hydrolase family protein [Verrucomicrobia bacterium]|nr:alpha/beta hydrolase family protein [Verrucomicrobiota bacterium]